MVSIKEMDLKLPLISVIMPAYNVEDFIGEAITSILNQSYPHFELLIWDDGSKDETFSIIQSFNDKRIKVFRNEINKGNLKTTNLLFEAAKGDFIALQDADDISDEKRLELLMLQFQLNSQLVLVGSFFNLIDKKGIIYQCGLLPLDNKEIKKEMEKEVIPILYPSIMFKKEIYKKCGGFKMFFNRKGFADFDWMARISLFGDVQNIPTALYNYRKHPESFTAVNRKKSFSGIHKYMHFLLCEAHNDRLKGIIDFFETNDVSSMKKRISNHLLKQSKINYWDQKQGAFNLIWKSIIFNPMNLACYRTLFYMIRKKR